jgi:hypothetical protein
MGTRHRVPSGGVSGDSGKHDGTNKDDTKLEEFAQAEREVARSRTFL